MSAEMARRGGNVRR